MATVVKISAIFSDDKGLEVVSEVLEVIKENNKAIVLDTLEFHTIYKGEVVNDYYDFLGALKNKSVYSSSQVVSYEGYFSTKELGELAVKREVNKFLLDKKIYYKNLIEQFNSKK